MFQVLNEAGPAEARQFRASAGKLGNIHEPQTRVDVTEIPTERQTQALRRHGRPINLPRFRHEGDDGRDEEETPDNATTDDEDDHTDTKKHG